MKNQKSLALVGLLLAGLTVHSQAVVVSNSDFDAGYSTGDLVGQSGTDDINLHSTYRDAGSAEPGDASGTSVDVVTGGLTYSAGDVYVDGGTQSALVTTTTGTAQNVINRTFSTALTGENIYARIVIDAEVSSFSGSTSLQFALDTNGIYGGPTYLGLAGNTAAASVTGAAAGTANSGLALAAGNNLLVAEFVFDQATGVYDSVNFFLDPTTTIQGTPTATATLSTGGVASLNGFELSLANLSGRVTTTPDEYGFDSFAVGTTYGDVVTAAVPEPSTVALTMAAGLGLLAFGIRRNRLV